MSQLSQHPALLQIEDTLDLIGQRYRVHRMARGAVLFGATVVLATVALAFFAHATEPGSRLAYVALPVWLIVVIGAAVAWVLRPLLIRPRSLEVARLVESRVPDLHNGLTNGLLLTQRDDLADNPWLPSVLDEIVQSTRGASPESAVTFADVKRLAITLSYAVVPALLLVAIFSGSFAHGFAQMWSPAAFVPIEGDAKIISVLPGDTTLVQGQPLEIVVLAEAAADAPAHVIFDSGVPRAEVIGSPAEDGIVRYTYRVDHVDSTLKYRIEIARTQSAWYVANVVQQVKLTNLSLRIAPPSYTKPEPESIVMTIKPEDLGKAPVEVLQGSSVDLSIGIDVPVAGGILQVDGASPIAMSRSDDGRQFNGSTVLLHDAQLAALLTETGGQIVARLPDPALPITVKPDAAPTIEVKWPTTETAVAPDAEVKVVAKASDDVGLSTVRVLMATSAGGPLTSVFEKTVSDSAAVFDLAQAIDIKPEYRKHGSSVRLQIEAVDNRNLIGLIDNGGPQTTQSPIYEIKFRDPAQIAADEKEASDKLREILTELLRQQNALHTTTTILKPEDIAGMAKVGTGQAQLAVTMQQTADTFKFNPDDTVVQKTLIVLATGPAKDAIDLTAAFPTEPVMKERARLSLDLQTRQRRIISTLESLLALLNKSPEPTTAPAAKEGGDLPNKVDALKKLNEDLKEFMKEQQRILDQTTNLAKKPVDNFDEKDKKLLDELLMSQEKLDAFMQQKVSDFSKLAEQDMSNATLLKELMEVYSEVTMAKDGLKKQAMEIAVAAEDAGLELASEITSNLEKWLLENPDRVKWTQEELLDKQDVPMAELPTELEDMIGELMEEQEDLFEDVEDMNANMTDSLDKGAGWDAADGPIANMSAKGVTGNTLPNNNEMGGRAGEGRSGKSQGEFVEDNATGKGGRNTPTRLDPTAFQQGQINDTSKDPVGGATGGGKMSGQGGEGLEGPVPPGVSAEMKRLAQKQAQIRNAAERLNLQYQLGRYDNFKLTQATALMRRVESDLNANRYDTALRRRDVLLDSIDTSHLLLSGEISVQHDTSPVATRKSQEQLNNAMNGDLPAAWSDALKTYYKKLGAE
ncbi:MAG TPA: hypothetical protein VGN72_02535 [Tepidisphaeraceae bacterium]|jgi:hypothetical protein|nr:hypothetical protein [Tepidisphaeraceae bacterium]